LSGKACVRARKKKFDCLFFAAEFFAAFFWLQAKPLPQRLKTPAK